MQLLNFKISIDIKKKKTVKILLHLVFLVCPVRWRTMRFVSVESCAVLFLCALLPQNIVQLQILTFVSFCVSSAAPSFPSSLTTSSSANPLAWWEQNR